MERFRLFKHSLGWAGASDFVVRDKVRLVGEVARVDGGNRNREK